MSFQAFVARRAIIIELIELLQLKTDKFGSVCINTNSIEKLESFYDQIEQYDNDKTKG